MDIVSKYLFDIQASISLIESFMDGIISFTEYSKDKKTQSAVERQLAIIGEVASKLKQADTAYTLPDVKRMVDFRNRLIHSYDNIDNAIVWAILKNHIPKLKEDIEILLNDGGN